ncbi:DUF2637 domain-containing protein [Spirillospora sp. NBC_01491]|uniref:DUF2637 domain-containing protein n=1 Tax=Spirillospora sp. NBC_01491 TaxID=2976007 RepID=UPI002E33FED7|nr:DUF2637 domain-containing protein [Spirillospora sp. NBC_01491]
MTVANRAQAITRWGAIALMATAVLTATAGGFAQSYAGLYHWALEHGLRGWKAESFPLLVDLFIIVGELGLFLLAIDAFVLRRKHLLSWLDFCLPLTIALAGWTASLIFNVGHVGQRQFSYQATAAVPPIVSMLGLFVLLRTLHRYVSMDEEAEAKEDVAEQRAIAPPVTLHQVTLMPLRSTGPFPQVPLRPDKAIESGRLNGAAAQSLAEAAAGTARAKSRAAAKAAQAAQAAPAAPTAPPEPEPVPAASAPAPVAPAPGPAVVAAAAASGLNGHGGLGATALDEPVSSALREISPENLRAIVIEILERHQGDVAATLADVTADGYRCDEAEIRRISDNHWFPYAVYRLLARHDGDGELVAQELASRGIVYDQAALDDLVTSWRV